jgi:type IV pilus assembly protein PilZ
MNDGPMTRLAAGAAAAPLAPSSPGPAAAAPTGSRPSVLSLAIKEKAALYAAYMPYLKNGGIFVPTNKPYQLGDEVYLILTLMDDPAKLPLAGKVVWISPTGGGARQPGIGVHFPADETGINARKKIEDLLGPTLKSARPTHTI